MGLALSSGQRHAPDKLHACPQPFVLPNRTMIGKEQSSLALRQDGMSPPRTVEEEK